MKTPLPVNIREENSRDQQEVRQINEAALGRSDEADLVDSLREEGAVLLSLVAELDSQIIGHILFTRMTIESAQGGVPTVSLAPMAVVPEHQGHQVGTRLVHSGLAELRARGEQIVLDPGHLDYYPKFGFSSAKALRLSSPFPPDAYMALELTPGALAEVDGGVRDVRLRSASDGDRTSHPLTEPA